MNAIQDIYFLSTGLGFVYIIGSSLMGSFHSHGGPGQGGGHGGGHAGHSGAHSGHGGAHVTHGAPAQTGGHAAGGHAAGNAHAGHSASHGGSGHNGAAKGPGQSSGHQSSSHTSQSSHQGSGATEEGQTVLSQSTSISRKTTDVPALYLQILDILSPTKWSFFLFLFGAIGIVSLKFLPAMLSLVPAAIGGWVLSNLFFNLMGNLLSKMGSSTNFRKEQLVGSLGELSLSIENGGLGEVVVSTGTAHLSASAKAFKPGQTIKKLTKVIVVDYKEGIFYVEPFDDQNYAVDADSIKD